jgi:RimJ/RimL family protein N-acetyltransferase
VSIGLRVPTAEDADAWAELFDDPEVMRYVGTGELRNREWYRAFVRRQQGLADTTGLCLFTVLVGGEVAGFAGIQPWTQPWVRPASRRSAGGWGAASGGPARRRRRHGRSSTGRARTVWRTSSP